MSLPRRSYFWRLLNAFFIGGLIPFMVLAAVFGVMSSRFLESAFRERAEEAARGASVLTGQLLDESAALAGSLAAEDAVIEYVRSAEKTPWQMSEIHRLFSSFSSSASFSPFIIPSDGSAVWSRSPVPEEYSITHYPQWGVFGALSRSVEPTVFFGPPHPRSGAAIALAAACRIYSAGEVIGYSVIDISRELLVSRIGAVSLSGGALTDLIIADGSDCVLFSMLEPANESRFLEDLPVNFNQYFMKAIPVRYGLTLYGLYPRNSVREYTGRVTLLTSVIALFSVLIALLMAVLLSRSFSRPIHFLTVTMEAVAAGNLEARCPALPGSEHGDELAVLANRFNSMIGRVSSLIDNLVAQERELRMAESRALQAQINPHFLYNTLNSIRAMAKLSGSTEIAGMTTALARIMREGSNPGSGFSTVEHSLSVARDYFSIESWRWPGRFEMRESIEPVVLEAPIPRLVIQPLVENALVHGLEKKNGPGILRIAGTLNEGIVTLEISDDGIGISRERLETVRAKMAEADKNPLEASVFSSGNEDSSGIALINTHRRLALIYGRQYGLSIEGGEGTGVTVRIRFPFSREGETTC